MRSSYRWSGGGRNNLSTSLSGEIQRMQELPDRQMMAQTVPISDRALVAASRLLLLVDDDAPDAG